MKLSLLTNLFKKKEKPQYFLAFILRDEKAIAVIFEELYQKAKIIGKGEAHFDTSLEEAPAEEFLDICDKAISKAEDVLPPDVETRKTIFCLKDAWILDAKIKKEYLDKLKKLCDELGLEPIGFLQTSEAILNLLKHEEGAPVTAVLVEFSKDFVIVSVVKAGKIIESKGAEISETEALTVENLLKHFQTQETLPSRILLYGKSSDKYLQQFLGHQWSKSLNFLHLPQANVLPDDLDVKGVLFGAATQLGFSAIADVIKKEAEEETPSFASSSAKAMEDKKATEGKEEIEEKAPVGVESDEAFGFLEGEDIATQQEEKEKKEKEEEEKTEHALEPEEAEEDKKREHLKSKEFIPSVLAFSQKGLSFLNILRGKKINKFVSNKIIVIPLVLIILVIILYVVYIFSLHANVILTLDSKTETEEKTVTFVENGETNAVKNEIGAEISSVTEEGSIDVKATGKKDTGTAAKGSVTVCSRFTEDRTLTSGTTITSNNLSFTTENSVKIASASADASADCTKATISVSAKQFGKEYNLPAGTKFTVANYSSSDIIAKNDNPFSGGTKKEITVISKEDLAKAQNNLIKNLQDKAKSDLTGKIPTDKVLLPLLVNPEIKDSSTNKKVGDEASTLSLKGTVSYDGVVYAKKDLTAFAKELFSDKLASNQVINEESVDVEVKKIEDENGMLVADLNFKVALLPKIEGKDLAKKIGGMKYNEAIDYLSKLPQIADVKINISPNIPFLPKSLPKFLGNINIQINR